VHGSEWADYLSAIMSRLGQRGAMRRATLRQRRG